MEYFKVKKEVKIKIKIRDKSEYYQLIYDELFTENELRKGNLFKPYDDTFNNVFENVYIKQNDTYKSFGARFECEHITPYKITEKEIKKAFETTLCYSYDTLVDIYLNKKNNCLFEIIRPYHQFDRIDILKDYQFMYILSSIDGVNPKTHDSITLDTIKNTLKYKLYNNHYYYFTV